MKMLAMAVLLLALQAPNDFEVGDAAEFTKIFPRGARVERLATGLRFVEGPAWHRDGFLIFSDIPANELKRWDPKQGVTTYRAGSNNANGNTFDREGRLLTAEHTAHRISRTSRDGSVETLVDRFEGRALNSPNDVIVRRDGTVWFTDPSYGLGQRKKEQEGQFVYRFDPATRTLTAVVRDFDQPNGLCFSPDESKLYVADSGKPRHIRVFDAGRDGALTNGRVFAAIDKGAPDGIRCDSAGRVWSSSGDGAQVFAPDGHLIARILMPEAAANLAFGGPKGTTLYLTARTSLYAVETAVTDGSGR
jgi:gluconolactonase